MNELHWANGCNGLDHGLGRARRRAVGLSTLPIGLAKAHFSLAALRLTSPGSLLLAACLPGLPN